jgi:hypothetical protein
VVIHAKKLSLIAILALLGSSFIASPAQGLGMGSIGGGGMSGGGMSGGMSGPVVETEPCTTGFNTTGFYTIQDNVITGNSGCAGSVTIPASVTSIGDSAFYGATLITSVSFQAGSAVTSIPAGAFWEAEGLESITIPKTVTSIGVNAFGRAIKLTTVTFEVDSALDSIGAGAFFEALSLESITIPENVTSIADGAFFNCNSLSTVTFDGVAPAVGSRAFGDVAVGAKAIVSPSFVDSFGSGQTWNGLELSFLLDTPVAPTPYSGALPIEYSDRTPKIGDEVTISGQRLDQVTSSTIDGVEVEISNKSSDGFTIVIPEGLEPGLKDLVLFGTFGKLTVQGAFTVEANPIQSSAVSSKTNAGVISRYVTIYAKGHKGKTLTWKIAGKWFETTITSDYQVFQRRTLAVGLDVFVHLYIDGEKQLTKKINTR